MEKKDEIENRRKNGEGRNNTCISEEKCRIVERDGGTGRNDGMRFGREEGEKSLSDTIGMPFVTLLRKKMMMITILVLLLRCLLHRNLSIAMCLSRYSFVFFFFFFFFFERHQQSAMAMKLCVCVCVCVCVCYGDGLLSTMYPIVICKAEII